MPITPASIRDRKPPPGAPPEGRFRVTIRVERPDGQFVTSTTLVPGDMMTSADRHVVRHMVTDKVMAGFVSTYQRAAELPE